jgi:CDP-diacylglycerol--glycerol-3-phosphate 3-phosphatidyltransferase
MGAESVNENNYIQANKGQNFRPLRPRLCTLPNLVTLLRPVCTPLFVLCCAQVQTTAVSWARWGGCILLVAIVSSDWLDGWLARRLGQESALGRLLDHVCDVVFLLSTLWFFVARGLAPWWLPAAIAWAFGLYVLDSWRRTAGQPQRLLLGSRLGHLGGVLYYVAVSMVSGSLLTGVPLLPPALVQGGFLLLALLAFVSGAERLWLLVRAHFPLP